MIHDYPIGVKEFDKIEKEGKELILITFEDLKQQRVLTLSQAAALIETIWVGSQAYRPVGDGRSKEFVDQSLNQYVWAGRCIPRSLPYARLLQHFRLIRNLLNLRLQRLSVRYRVLHSQAVDSESAVLAKQHLDQVLGVERTTIEAGDQQL